MQNNYMDIELDYALRMVRTGFATPEQAAKICGIPLHFLQTHLQPSEAQGSAALRGSVRSEAA